MSDFLQQAIEDAMKDIEQRIHDALEQMPPSPVIVESTAIVLDATPVMDKEQKKRLAWRTIYQRESQQSDAGQSDIEYTV